jgi:hypothetical protein
MVYKTWAIEKVQMDGDEVAQAAAAATNTISFTEEGVVELSEGSKVISGTFTINKTATSMTTSMGGSTDTFVISDLGASSMTLSRGEEKMVLKAK